MSSVILLLAEVSVSLLSAGRVIVSLVPWITVRCSEPSPSCGAEIQLSNGNRDGMGVSGGTGADIGGNGAGSMEVSGGK